MDVIHKRGLPAPEEEPCLVDASELDLFLILPGRVEPVDGTACLAARFVMCREIVEQ